jgi:hypothetical protein
VVHAVLGHDVAQLLELERGEALSQTGLADLGVDRERVQNTRCPPPAASSRLGRLRLARRERALERRGEPGGARRLARDRCYDACEGASELGAPALVQGKQRLPGGLDRVRLRCAARAAGAGLPLRG